MLRQLHAADTSHQQGLEPLVLHVNRSYSKADPMVLPYTTYSLFLSRFAPFASPRLFAL